MRDLAVRVPAVRALEEGLACHDLFEWLETEATKLARLGGEGRRVGFTDALLRSRGVRTVVRESPADFAHDATIEFGSDGSVIRYAATTATRIRFSLAHEIGHTYFLDVDRRSMLGRGLSADPTVEALCDFFARALLLPKDRLVDRVNQLAEDPSIPPLHLVPQLAGEFEVAEQAVARRLVFDLFGGFVAAVCTTDHGDGKGWRTTWCAPLGEHDLPRSSGWRIPLNSRGRRIPFEMVPTCEAARTTAMSVDGRWADLCRPKTTTRSRMPFSRRAPMAEVNAVVASVPLYRGLFDEPTERCFLALREKQ